MAVWLSVRVYELAELRLPDDFEARKAAAHNRELGASIKATKGPIHPPVIENATGEIVCGVDRIAAQVVGGETRFECRGWMGSPEELRMVRAAENAFRRDDKAAWATEYVEAKKAVKAANKAQRDEATSVAATKDKPGPARGEEREARDEAARELGMEPEALRSRLRREADVEPVVAKPPKAAPIESRIRVLAREVEASLALISALYDELAPTQHEARRLLDKAMTARVALQDALTGAAEAIDAGRAAIRDTGKANKETRGRSAGQRLTAEKPAPYAPRKGLGGRKLEREHEEPVEDAQGELRPPCGAECDNGAPCALAMGHENDCAPGAF